MADDKKQKIKVLDGSNTPMYEGKPYWEEPSMLDKAKITSKRVTSKIYDDALKLGRATGKPERDPQAEKEPIPSDIADKLQTMKNNRAADQYEKNKTFKSGGKVGSASKRADGCCVKGKTRGKMC